MTGQKYRGGNMLDAHKARVITQEALNGKNGKITKAVERILSVVEEAATKGQSAINISQFINYDTKHLIESQLKGLGFKVESHHDQRDGDSWTTLSW